MLIARGGLILVIAMLTIPTAIAGRLVKGIVRMMIVSALLGVLFTTVGLGLSYTWNLTSGASIILVAGAGYLLSLIPWRRLRRAQRP